MWLSRLARSLSTANPFIWGLMWRHAGKAPLLLPHDKSYLALVHFAQEPNGLFLDVGANNGISALSFRRLNKTYRILSLEPDPRHELALRRVARKIDRFEYRIIGAGRRRETRVFHTPRYKSVVLHTFTSTDRQQAMSAVRESFGPKVGDATQVSSAKWPIVPIDDLDLDPAIIKIDVEGLDADVLLGANKTVERARPFLMVEACHVGVTAFDRFCERHAYAIFAYDVDEAKFQRLSTEDDAWSVESNNVFLVPKEKESLIPILGRGA